MTHHEFAETVQRQITLAIAEGDQERADVYGTILELMRRVIFAQEVDGDIK